MAPAESDRFYEAIEPLADFGRIGDGSGFHDLPRDWFVVVTDIRGSTKAIESGRYKDVNTAGASAIACVQNALGDFAFPYVFGGDGATLVIPPGAIAPVRKALGGLKTLIRENFDLTLRAGAVPAALILETGKALRVARFRLPGGRSIALFTGGGLSAAEELVKGSDEFEMPGLPAEPGLLKGLSCRWKPIPSRKGRVLSLLVLARDGGAVYEEVVRELEGIFGEGIESANPVAAAGLEYKPLVACVRDERRYESSSFSRAFFGRLVEILVAMLMFGFRRPSRALGAREYVHSLAAHSDYRKFDDALRMVLDCTGPQVRAVRDYLEGRRREGRIYYGVHEAGDALMTCYVQGLEEGRHVHFIDGGGGGYAMAAKQLKDQVKQPAKK